MTKTKLRISFHMRLYFLKDLKTSCRDNFPNIFEFNYHKKIILKTTFMTTVEICVPLHTNIISFDKLKSRVELILDFYNVIFKVCFHNEI